MNKKVLFSAVLCGLATVFVGTASLAAPTPPVRQSIGFRDVLMVSLTEAECRGCHSSGVQNRHHLLYGTGPLLPANYWYNSRSDKTPPDPIPNPDADGNSVRDTTYTCMTCHSWTGTGDAGFTVERNCVACHQRSPHHKTDAAQQRHCKSCHGSVVDDFDDGHYIPTYAPSMVTPRRSGGEALPLNNAPTPTGAGACNYCHDQDPAISGTPNAATAGILNNHDLHHNDKLDTTDPVTGVRRCTWCHDNNHVTGVDPPFAITVRSATAAICENCHGAKSLHNIQADSPATGNVGTIVVGGELSGYGHVGRDAGSNDSDCWGCHGFKTAALAPGSGPLIPTVNTADRVVLTAGTSAPVVVLGASFVNTVGTTTYEAKARLTAADGSSVTLQPDVIANQGAMTVTIPGSTAPGNYRLRALKNDFTSNPVVISVIPKVAITKATPASKERTVTILGGGFAGYAAGSGASVIGTTSNGKNVKGAVVSWKDGKIVAKFSTLPSTVTVNSIYGSVMANVR